MSQEENYKFISEMKCSGNSLTDDQTDFDRWKTIRDHYKKELNNEIWGEIDDEVIYYTPHCYKNHCVNIYGILESILLENIDINARERFVLAVAIILHDYTMHRNEVGFRKRHSRDAADYIKKEMFKVGTILQSTLHEHEVPIVQQIILAHSDIKDESGEKVHTFATLKPSTIDYVNGVEVNVTLLAALLRLGDELDQSAARLNGHMARYADAEKYHYGDKSEISGEQIMGKTSFGHWTACRLISKAKPSPELGTTILLEVDCAVLERWRELGNFTYAADLLHNAHQKIAASLKEVREVYFNRMECKENFRYFHVQLSFGASELEDEYIRALNTDTNANSKGENQASSPANSSKDEGDVSISDYVLTHRLYVDGHYTISESISARDWIDTFKLFCSEKMETIITSFQEEIQKLPNEGEEICIMAVDFPSLILGSALSFRTSFPLSYIHRKESDEYHIDPEKDLPENKDFKIVLITDVIVTGNSIGEVLSILETRGYQVTSIMSVFLRNPFGRKIDRNEKILSKVWSLNSALPIEICSRDKKTCLFKKECERPHDNDPISVN